jgi:hypothetical protein
MGVRSPVPEACGRGAGSGGLSQEGWYRASPSRPISPQTIDWIFEVQSDGIDLVIGTRLKIGVGYCLLPEGRAGCWGGAGGALALIDVDRRMPFAYVAKRLDAATAQGLAVGDPNSHL